MHQESGFVGVAAALPPDGPAQGWALSEGAALAVGRVGRALGPGLQVTQYSTAPNTTNIATTQTATSKDSVGMWLISYDERKHAYAP
jgi:hypothetical protein